MGKTIFGAVLQSVGIIFVLAAIVFRIYCFFDFKWNCEDHLKSALSNSNTTQAALSLNNALIYLENHNYTQGYTTILGEDPSENVGHWYLQVRNFYASLKNTELGETRREQNLALGKETLNIPSGISIFPYNTECFWTLLFGAFLFLISNIYGIGIAKQFVKQNSF